MFVGKGEDGKGEVKLIDFGLACQLQQSMKQLAGTPYYIAPEVLSKNYGKECDIWSLGVVIYFMLSGQMPFDGRNLKELYRNIKTAKLKMPSIFCDDLKDLITQMLKKDPAERITAQDAMKHNWFKHKLQEGHDHLPPEESEQIFKRLVAFQGRSKLKKTVLSLIAKMQSNDLSASAKKIFAQIDTDKSGVIDKEELHKAIQSADSQELNKLDMAQINTLISQIDGNDNQQIEYTEFLAATLDEDILQKEEVLKGVFNLFDLDNNGAIDKEELVKVFSKFGKEITKKEIQIILEMHDPHHKDQIDFHHFK